MPLSHTLLRSVPLMLAGLGSGAALGLTRSLGWKPPLLFGALVAYLVFNGYRASTINFQSFSQVAFTFVVTPALMAGGLLMALIMGFLGGLFPAIRSV